MTYTPGDLVRITATFTDSVGTPVDPTDVTAQVKDPTGIVSTPTPTPTGATGVYTLDVTVDLTGHWYYRIVGTGAHQAAAEGKFTVGSSFFA